MKTMKYRTAKKIEVSEKQQFNHYQAEPQLQEMNSFSALLCFFSLTARFSDNSAEVKDGVNKNDPKLKILPFCRAD